MFGIGLVAALLAAVLPAPQADLSAKVDQYVSGYLAQTGLPGATVAITHGGQVVHVAGYGHDSTGATLTAATRMPVASLSKSVTALAVLQLVDAGEVRLDDPVRRYLPDFRTADPRGDRITVRQLLNQTSGMADSAFPDLRRAQADSLAGAVTRLHEAELASDPGTKYAYHNPNYQVAARIVEVVAGVPFADYLRRQVFEPIGMTSSSAVDTARDARDVTHGYVRAYGTAIPADEPDWFFGGSHGVITTAGDLARWLVTQTGNGRAPGGRQVVSAEAVAEMHTPSGVDGSEYGMGWRREGDAVTHNGQLFTYTAEEVLLPSTGYGIAVITDTGMSLEDDSAVLAEGLTALTRGENAPVRRPAGTYVDWVLAVLTLAVLALGVLGLARSRRWAEKRSSAWRAALRLVPYAGPAVLLVLLPQIAGFVFAGRAGTMLQVTYVLPALVAFLGAAAVLAVGVLLTRVFWLLRTRTR